MTSPHDVKTLAERPEHQAMPLEYKRTLAGLTKRNERLTETNSELRKEIGKLRATLEKLVSNNRKGVTGFWARKAWMAANDALASTKGAGDE